MERRPIADAMRAWLAEESKVWQALGIVEASQSSRIFDIYEPPDATAARRRSKAFFIVTSLAALLIGLAILLVVSYNWQDMTATVKLAVLFGSLLALHVSALGLRRSGRELTSELVFFVACILFGACIWLIAQIFNIQSHYPDGFWYWAVGTLVFTLCLDTVLLHILYVVILAIWVGTEVLGFQGLDLWYFHGTYCPRAAWSLPLLVLPGLLWAYRKKSVTAVGLYAPLLAWWAILQPVAWTWEVSPIYFVGLAGVLLLLIAEMHAATSPMAKPYRIYGVLVTGGVLVPLSYADIVIYLLHGSPPWDNVVAGLVVFLIGALAALAVVLWQQRRSSTGRASSLELVQRQWLPLAMLLLLAGMCFWSAVFTQYSAGPAHYITATARDAQKWTPQVLVPVIAFNVAMIGLALWLIRVGLREDNSQDFSLGVFYFLLWAVLRYKDLFAGVGGMLGAALLFLLCGIGLLLVARYWFHRKEENRA